jgi:long-chain fatty acid transport protein
MATPAARYRGVVVSLELGLLAVLLAASPAHALEGYMQHGYGARQTALGGAGAADGRDATTIILNPAGLVHLEDEADISAGIFSPTREFDGSGTPGLTPTGSLNSNSLYFFVPNSAFSYRVDPNPYVDVLGVAFYGNGANTTYPDFARTDCLNGGTGLYCSGAAGVDLQQYFMALAAAKTIAPGFSIGLGPVFGMQQFRAKGLALFAPVDNVPDQAWGWGVRGGFEWAIAPDFRFAGQITSQVFMQSFTKYANLLAGRGDCDVPANGQVGVAYDAMPNLTLMLDYQRIAYGQIRCVANPAAGGPFGAEDGPAFGWRDIDAVKLGIEWRNLDGLTLRAGYSYNTALFGPHDVQLDILAPAATQHHITAGAAYTIDKDWAVEIAGLYAPSNTVSGTELGLTSGHQIDVSTTQWEVLLGIKYFYDPILLH